MTQLMLYDRELSSPAQRVLHRLRQGPATNLELAAVGGLRFGARLMEIREAGHKVKATRVDKRIVRYELL